MKHAEATHTIALAIILLLLFYSAMSLATQVPDSNTLDFTSMQHIQFDDIAPNQIAVQDNEIRFEVDNSASFMMLGFRQVRTVSAVSLLWRSNGGPAIRDRQHERDKDGDDAVLKIALLLAGEQRGFSWFLPDWIKQVRSHLFLQSDEVRYLVAGARHAAGESWPNPYNDDIQMLAMHNEDASEGNTLSSIRFEAPLRVVGLWVMADGDNTNSRFKSYLYDIKVISDSYIE